MISSRLSLKLIQIHPKAPPENDYFYIVIFMWLYLYSHFYIPVCTVCVSSVCRVTEHTLLGCSEMGSWAHNLQILLCFTANSCPERFVEKEGERGERGGLREKKRKKKKKKRGESSHHNGRVGSEAIWQEATIHTQWEKTTQCLWEQNKQAEKEKSKESERGHMRRKGDKY